MTIDYLVDIKKENKESSYVLDIRNISSKNDIELSFEVLEQRVLDCLIAKDFKKCYELLTCAFCICQNSDAYFLLDFTVKASELISLTKELDKNNIVLMLDQKSKLLSLAKHGKSSRTAKLGAEHKAFLKTLRLLSEDINDLDLIERLKNNISDYVSFYTYRVLKSSKLSVASDTLTLLEKEILEKVSKLGDAAIGDMLSKVYEDDFLESKEFASLNIKFENCDKLLAVTDKCHSLYMFNKTNIIEEKITILTNSMIITGFLGTDRLIKEFVVKQLVKNKEVLVDFQKFKEMGENIVVSLVSTSSKASNLIPCI